MVPPPRIVDQIFAIAERDAARELIVSGADRVTYGLAAQSIRDIAKSLSSSGLKPGARVAYMGVPAPGFLLSMAATHVADGVWMGLNPRYTAAELAHVISDAEPSLIVVEREADPQALNKIEEAVAIAGSHAIIQTVDHWRELTSITAPLSDTATAPPEGTALIVYTSGTTGAPKGACLSHIGMVEAARLYAERYRHPELRSLLNLPINHVGALIDLTSAAIAMEGTLVAMPSFDPATIPAVLAAERISILGQVPTMHLMIEAATGYDPTALSHLKHLVWSGASMPRAFIERYHNKGVELSTCYGQTECTGSVTFSPPDATIDMLADGVGMPAQPGLIRIVSIDGRLVEDGEAGEILVRGASLMKGYFNRPEATAAALIDGWLHTGDLGLIGKAGDVRLVGRLKEMYKSGGYNVYPREIEVALEEHPAIEAAAVIAMPDPRWDEVGWAFLMASSDVSEADLAAYARARLANYKMPKRMIIRSELPLLPIGKIDKRKLKEAASAGAYD
ncbi:MAG: acyl--CoA ligase [Sphingopyxis sp.]|nr:acyl--CoA ligase [Sphingopyxis sp.]